MNCFQKMNVCALLSLSVLSAKAQTTYMEMEQLTVNDQVTTVITASEPIRFVDISTDKVVGDQPINNTIRLKPKDNVYADGEVLAIVTIVTERYRTQYVEKPRDFDPFGQTGFAHLWLQYDCPFKVLVLGVNFILPF